MYIEENSGKQEIFHLFTLMDVIKKNPNSVNSIQQLPCDIQTQIFQVKDIDTNTNRNYCIEMFVPHGTEEYNSVRPLYYPATDAFIVIFSIKSQQSFDDIRSVYLPEIRRFIDENNSEIPIVLVGNHTEYRDDESFSGELVDSQDAVQVAQEFSVSKYIEVFSENVFHVQEIFQQTVHAITTFHANSATTDYERKRKSAFEDEYFRSLLTVPTPEGEFDQFERTFEINTLEEVDYYYTLDESDPNKLCSRYNGEPIKFRTPYPKSIRVVALDRCKYASDIASFEIPSESNDPVGYFDPITKGFHVSRRHNTVYFYTVDGSKPTNKSSIYEEPGVIFDENPNACFVDQVKLPQQVRVVAVEQNKFKSKVKNFKPFEGMFIVSTRSILTGILVLAPPTVHFSDNMLRIDTIPGIVYKYTTDGTIPNYHSPTCML
jgi:GTPase SAR1 family protein